MQNPLLTDFTFIPFRQFNLTDLDNALMQALTQTKDNITLLEQQQNPSWASLAKLLHLPVFKLNRLWNLVEHLLAVDDSKELRQLQEKFQPLITEFHVNLGQNSQIYQHYLSIKNHQKSQLSSEQQKVVDNEIRDFFLSGVSLAAKAKQQFKDIETKLAELSTKFEQNLLDATDSFTKFVTKDELTGVPPDVLANYQEQAKQDGNPELYKLTLHIPNYLPLMEYCDNRKLREELYYAYATRASEFGQTQLDNSKIITQILSLCQEKSQLLGFNNYTELSLYTKMAGNSQQVLDFLYQLADKTKTQAHSDLDEIKELAIATYQISKIEAWDIAYFSEKLRQQKYSYSNNELKQYFQFPIVLDGLFQLIGQLYQVDFVNVSQIPVWHNDVLTYNLVKNNETIGTLYLDLFARTGKLSGAWMNSAQDRYIEDEIAFKPYAYIICNFTQPLANNNALLTFDEVQTLFHEMGHALHHLLTKINHFAISGINGVEWDAVELPSQFMEHFVWNYTILKTLTKHVQTSQVLPEEFYTKLLKSRYFQSGLQMLRQLEFAIYDIMLYQQAAVAKLDYLKLLDDIRKQVAVFIPPSYNRFPNTFSHIFAGGYASGYYSYKWAELLACDIFRVFDLADLNKYPELGAKFLTLVLAQGGLKPMLDNFKSFMGREPQINALFHYSGIKDE